MVRSNMLPLSAGWKYHSPERQTFIKIYSAGFLNRINSFDISGEHATHPTAEVVVMPCIDGLPNLKLLILSKKINK